MRLVDGATPDLNRFVTDVAFSSPSAAASVIATRSASGPRVWTVKDTGQTYRDWRAARLDRIEDKIAPALKRRCYLSPILRRPGCHLQTLAAKPLECPLPTTEDQDLQVTRLPVKATSIHELSSYPNASHR